ncbi:MAG: hypothetical protein K5945_11335 [Bacteroidaceae bacterium]|nr:hypothetical protein [Bacteroidaceae bacterium]
MKGEIIVLLSLVISLIMSGCSCEKGKIHNMEVSECEKAFFGDSIAVLMLNKPQNGYHISFIHSKQLNLMHFERGDSICQYCAIHKLPFELRNYEEDSIGVFNVDIDFPILKLDTLGGSKDAPDMFFMDMNFDDEEEFVVKHEGYNRFYYACFDLVKGNWESSCPGILESTNTPPYNNIVSGIVEQPSYTVFDYNEKTIYVYETMGCCSFYETWAKYYEGDMYGTEAKVKVYKKVHHDRRADGTEHVETYKLINDTLTLVE